LWTCPGHNGGVFYSRSPIGRVFVEHLGEAVFRDDLDNSVLDLGDLLTHEGPALKAQKEAAQIFGAEKTYFVLNGTSTSNKVALGALVTDGDLVLFDRNNHKAAHHGALMIAGGIPVYIPTVRNAWGLIGPMRWDALDEAALRERIRNHPLVKDTDAWRRPRPFRVAVVEECTYDGTIHSAEMILRRIGHLCDYILFDEAWAGFMKFHPLYAGRFAMGLSGLDGEAPGIIATQSTHKQLASFSQASQIHLRDRHIKGQKRRIEHRRFNESFMQHASTSPFYPLFASLDVGAQMMKGRSGEVLWDDTIRLGIELRKKIRAVRREFEEKEMRPERRWFFEPFVPDRVAIPDVSREGAVHDVAWATISRCSRPASTRSPASRSRFRASTRKSMHPAAPDCILTWSRNESADAKQKPGNGERTAGAGPPFARQRCRGDAFDLPPPYPRRHRGGRRRQRRAGAGGFERPAQGPAQSPPAASGRDLRRRSRGLRLCGLFRKRPAYRFTAKHSIYVHHAHQGRGVGRLLMQELIDTCAASGFRQMIGYIDADNTASLAIHEKFGFRKVGLLPGVAYRYGRWADTVMVQRSLAAGTTEPPLISDFVR
jgi:GNAT superfamily N-acetyltransferase